MLVILSFSTVKVSVKSLNFSNFALEKSLKSPGILLAGASMNHAILTL